MRKIILVAIICFSLLIIPANPAQVHAASNSAHAASNSAEATTEFVYKSTKKTQIDRGGTSVKTGDSTEPGRWLMLGSGSGILLLFLLLGLKRRNEEESGEA